jgi:CRP-like cAMP-binding protein
MTHACTGTDINKAITAEQLEKVSLFHDVTKQELQNILHNIPYAVTDYKKGEIVIITGQYLDRIAILLCGVLSNKSTTIEGKEYINRIYEPDDIIGLAICSTFKKTAADTIIATEKSSLLWMDYEKLINIDIHGSALNKKIHYNIESDLAEEIFHKDALYKILTKKTVREKILTYLSIVAEKRGSNQININMNQTELANFINVSRQTLSLEMSKLRKEGMIEYYGKDVTILWK